MIMKLILIRKLTFFVSNLLDAYLDYFNFKTNLEFIQVFSKNSFMTKQIWQPPNYKILKSLRHFYKTILMLLM